MNVVADTRNRLNKDFHLSSPILVFYCVRLSHGITCSFSKFFKVAYHNKIAGSDKLLNQFIKTVSFLHQLLRSEDTVIGAKKILYGKSK